MPPRSASTEARGLRAGNTWGLPCKSAWGRRRNEPPFRGIGELLAAGPWTDFGWESRVREVSGGVVNERSGPPFRVRRAELRGPAWLPIRPGGSTRQTRRGGGSAEHAALPLGGASRRLSGGWLSQVAEHALEGLTSLVRGVERHRDPLRARRVAWQRRTTRVFPCKSARGSVRALQGSLKTAAGQRRATPGQCQGTRRASGSMW